MRSSTATCSPSTSPRWLTTAVRIRLVGNLPYNLSTPILFHALEHAAAIRDMHFMLQKEVVDRMAAGPGSKVYGRLSVMLQAYCHVTPLFNVPPGAFRPPPKVDSAVVRLVPRDPATIGVRDHATFANVVRDAFGQRRKTLRNALSQICDAAAIEAAGVRPDARAEQIEVADFVRLANSLAGSARPECSEKTRCRCLADQCQRFTRISRRRGINSARAAGLSRATKLRPWNAFTPSTSMSPPATSTTSPSPSRIATSSPTPSASATAARCPRAC